MLQQKDVAFVCTRYIFFFCSPNVIPEDAISHTSFPFCRIKDSRNVNRSTGLNICRKSTTCESQDGRLDLGAAYGTVLPSHLP